MGESAADRVAKQAPKKKHNLANFPPQTIVHADDMMS
jgi:hypothetical protein